MPDEMTLVQNPRFFVVFVSTQNRFRKTAATQLLFCSCGYN